MPETTPLIKAALNLRVGAGFDVYLFSYAYRLSFDIHMIQKKKMKLVASKGTFYLESVPSP